MGERKPIQLRSPITWIAVAATLAVAVTIGILGNRAGQGDGAKARRSASKPERAPPGQRLFGKGFSIPIPKQFQEDKVVAAKAAKRGGYALVAIGRTKVPNAFHGSIVVIPVPSRGQTLDHYDGNKLACTESLAIVQTLDATIRMTALPFGRVCQVVGTERNHKTRGMTSTFIKQPGVNRAFFLTCIYDTRDDIAQKACNIALRGWRFEKN